MTCLLPFNYRSNDRFGIDLNIHSIDSRSAWVPAMTFDADITYPPDRISRPIISHQTVSHAVSEAGDDTINTCSRAPTALSCLCRAAST